MSRRAPHQREAYKAFRTIQTRWMDNDVYGHVNNVIYYSWFDTAVNGWLLEQNILKLGDPEIVGLVVETGCSYFKPVKFPDTLEAGLRISAIGNSSVRYEIGLFLAGEVEPAAEGFFVHVCVGAEDHRPVRVPDKWRNAMQNLFVQN